MFRSHPYRPVQSFRRSVALTLLACALSLGVVHAADVNASFVDNHVEVQQVVAGEGYRSIGFQNFATESVTFTLARLRAGVSLGDYAKASSALQKALSTNAGVAASAKEFDGRATALGGITVGHYGDAEMFANLTQGTYVVTATRSSDGRVAHASFTVTSSGSPVGAPTPQRTLTLGDSSVSTPTSFAGGTVLFKIANDGSEPQVVTFFQLRPGKTAADVKAYLGNAASDAAKAPFDPNRTFSVGAVSPGAEVYIPLDFSMGRWVAVRMSSDLAKPGAAQLSDGMYKEFSVS